MDHEDIRDDFMVDFLEGTLDAMIVLRDTQYV